MDGQRDVTAYLGLGGNLGDRRAHLRAGLQQLAPQISLEAVSPLYETDPVGVVDQPAFLNAVCRVRTSLDPHALLGRAKEIERAAGRQPGLRWGPRPLDIDILLYGDSLVELPDLEIPHPRLAERAFVLCPLADLAAELRVPGLDRSVRDLLRETGDRGVRLIAASGWDLPASG